MKRIYHNHKFWEDYHAGMYEPFNGVEKCDLIPLCAQLLKNRLRFAMEGKRMIEAWKYAAEHNLTNKESNRKSWIGQATCCFVYGAPMDATIMGWHMLTEEEKAGANAVASQLIEEFELENRQRCLRLDLE